ncbi:inositol 2-dehydrogenase [Echinicola jeungdonensis]|uniref:Inositol 2-dehydrogenase n=1 Tax=Echinicola jeungdonensis TaxID=709343 RepID=A0ABV5J9M9_9BACT|nr:inositol 2-dehydrogenase [Echinicola jeungdonensis]MDN3670372.1 inositol 2-dehydrogenase [Echinicola jeungdonensis]
MKKINIGIIGLGRIGQIHFSNLKYCIPNANLVMVADPQKAGEFNGVPIGTAEEVINHEKIEAVVICSPTDTHSVYIEKCALAGKDIFCEKPHDLSLERVVCTLESVKKAEVKLMLGFNRRFDGNFKKIQQLVAQNKIGDPTILKITSRDPGPPPLEYLKSSGGMFMDMSIHDFDMARFIMGKEVEKVYASAGVFSSNDVKEAGDIDTAIITLTFIDGSMAVIDNCRKAVYGYDQRLEVFGNKGMAQIDNNKHDTHLFFDQSGSHGALPLDFFMDRYVDSYKNEMERFVEALCKDEPVPVNGQDGLEAMMIALAANLSVAEGRPVMLSEIMKMNRVKQEEMVNRSIEK